jgi:hypothetical protein
VEHLLPVQSTQRSNVGPFLPALIRTCILLALLYLRAPCAFERTSCRRETSFLVSAKTRRHCEELVVRCARSSLYLIGAKPLGLLGVIVETCLLCCACFACSHNGCQMHISMRTFNPLNESNFTPLNLYATQCTYSADKFCVVE